MTPSQRNFLSAVVAEALKDVNDGDRRGGRAGNMLASAGMERLVALLLDYSVEDIKLALYGAVGGRWKLAGYWMSEVLDWRDYGSCYEDAA